MQLNNLQRNTKRKVYVRIGRGGKRGKTSGHGIKGQKARAGHKIRPEIRDMMKRFPKLRGFGKNRGQTNVYSPKVIALNVYTLESVFASGNTVSPETIIEKGIATNRQILSRSVKILGSGTLTKKLTVTGFTVSGSARAKIIAAGGSCS